MLERLGHGSRDTKAAVEAGGAEREEAAEGWLRPVVCVLRY